MLGKLIRYDLKYGARLFCVFHGLLFAAVFMGRFFFLDRIDLMHAPAQSLLTPLTLLLSLFILLFTVMPLATQLIVGARFYKNLFTDEGYLSWTLPVSKVQQLWGKIISGLIWMVLDILLTYGAGLLLVSGENVQLFYAQHSADLAEALGMSVPDYFLLIFALSLMGTFSNVLMLYSSISIGQLFPAHRLLCAVITYFVLYSALTMVSTAFLLGAEFFPLNDANALNSTFSMAEYMKVSMRYSLIFSFIAAAIQYLATHYIVTKKLNLN